MVGFGYGEKIYGFIMYIDVYRCEYISRVYSDWKNIQKIVCYASSARCCWRENLNLSPGGHCLPIRCHSVLGSGETVARHADTAFHR